MRIITGAIMCLLTLIFFCYGLQKWWKEARRESSSVGVTAITDGNPQPELKKFAETSPKKVEIGTQLKTNSKLHAGLELPVGLKFPTGFRFPQGTRFGPNQIIPAGSTVPAGSKFPFALTLPDEYVSTEEICLPTKLKISKSPMTIYEQTAPPENHDGIDFFVYYEGTTIPAGTRYPRDSVFAPYSYLPHLIVTTSAYTLREHEGDVMTCGNPEFIVGDAEMVLANDTVITKDLTLAAAWTVNVEFLIKQKQHHLWSHMKVQSIFFVLTAAISIVATSLTIIERNVLSSTSNVPLFMVDQIFSILNIIAQTLFAQFYNTGPYSAAFSHMLSIYNLSWLFFDITFENYIEEVIFCHSSPILETLQVLLPLAIKYRVTAAFYFAFVPINRD